MVNSTVYYERALYKLIHPFFDRKEIIGIRGPRQTGKTTLLKKFQEAFSNQGHKTHFLNLDNYKLREIFMEDPLSIIVKEKEPSEKLVLFIDEIQKAENAGESLKLIYDEYSDIKIFFSGSSSLEIKENVLPPLVGRVILFDLHSFDFQEFIEAHDPGLKRLLDERVGQIKILFKIIESNSLSESESGSKSGVISESKSKALLKNSIKNLKTPVYIDDFRRYFQKFLIWGGYPETVKDLVKEWSVKKRSDRLDGTSNLKQIILQNTINIYLEKDIKVHYNIEHFTAYISLSKILSTSLGGIVINSELASNLQISEPTVKNYLTILEHSYLIKLLTPYHKNLKSELRKQQKCYFMDNGMRNALLENFSPYNVRGASERGYLLENFVFRQLLTNFVANYKGWKLHYWRTKGGAEIDFILTKGDLVIPIEIKLGGKKISRGFYSFLEAYQPKLAFVATIDTFKIEEKVGIPIIWLPAYYF